MFAIETELGRFEAATEKEAKAAMRKAQRGAKAAAEEKSARYNRALERAAAAGFDLLKRKLTGEGMAFEWTDANTPCGPRVTAVGERHQMATVDTADGAAEIELYGYRCAGAVVGPGGWCKALAMQDADRPGETEFYAVGVCEGVFAWTRVPGVSRADYPDLA